MSVGMSNVRPVHVPESDNAESGCKKVHGNQSKQHHDRRGKGVDEELLRSVLAVFSTPFEDEEEHWNECQLPEDIEHEQVQSDKDADQCTSHHEYEWEVHGCVLFIPRSNDGNGQQESCQPYHWEGESVHTDTPMDSQCFDPFITEFKIKRTEIHRTPVAHVVHLSEEHHGGHAEHDERDDERHHTNGRTQFFTGRIGSVSDEHEQNDAADQRESNKG